MACLENCGDDFGIIQVEWPMFKCEVFLLNNSKIFYIIDSNAGTKLRIAFSV